MRPAIVRSALKAALIWGAIGFAVAVFFFVLSLFTDALAYVELVFWPSSLAFMALDNSTAPRLDRVEGTAFLILTNIVLYFIVGFVLTLGWKAVRTIAVRHQAPSQAESPSKPGNPGKPGDRRKVHC
jgi:hypothetical protein